MRRLRRLPDPPRLPGAAPLQDVRQLGAVQTGQAGTRPAQHGQGQWHYVPNELVSPPAPAPQPQPGSPAANNDGTTAPRRRRRNRPPRGGPPSRDGASDRSEQAESETLTYDPTVSAGESSAAARRARRHDLTETDRQEYNFPVPLKPPFLDEPTNPLCATTAKRSFPPRTSSILSMCCWGICEQPFLPRKGTVQTRHRGTPGWDRKSMSGGLGALHLRHPFGATTLQTCARSPNGRERCRFGKCKSKRI